MKNETVCSISRYSKVISYFIQQDGKKDNELIPLDEILQKMTQTRYTFEELQERPLPDGVDPLKLESYLDDEEFEEILSMFYLLGNNMPRRKM